VASWPILNMIDKIFITGPFLETDLKRFGISDLKFFLLARVRIKCAKGISKCARVRGKTWFVGGGVLHQVTTARAGVAVALRYGSHPQLLMHTCLIKAPTYESSGLK
jgi:hypothetical protein